MIQLNKLSIALILSVTLGYSCTNMNSNKASAIDSNVVMINEDSLVGVLVWNSKAKELNKTIFINSDLQEKCTFETLENFEECGYSPYGYSSDYDILTIRVVGIDSNYYHVCVNEKTSTILLISREDSNFTFQNWQDHILTAFSVDFDSSVNPLYQSIESTVTIPYQKDEFYHPISISGDWLCVEDDDGIRSFIRWRKDKKLLVDISYVA